MGSAIQGGEVMAEGKIFWNLPPQVSYTAGEKLSCAITVVAVLMSIQERPIKAKLSSGSTVVSEEDVPLNGEETFTLVVQGRLSLEGAFVTDRTSVILDLFLCDKDRNALDKVSTFLSSPAWLPVPVEITATMRELMPLMAGALFLALVGILASRLVRRK